MAEKEPPTIALCYDYDGTLITGHMQENSFIPAIDMKKDDFWKEVKAHAKTHDMDEVLAYMHLMLEKSQQKEDGLLNQKSLKEYGKKVSLFPGVEDWFDSIKDHHTGVQVQHFIISSGIDDMIRGSLIGDKFHHIFASGFMYDAKGDAVFPARSINYTTKVQYLFRVNKGIKNSWDNSKINAFIPEEKRNIPFSQMIYIGDGETDIPAMKMMNFKGGYSIAVYPPDEQAKKSKAEELQKDGRCQFIAEADYSKDKRLFHIVSSLIDRIANEHQYHMNTRARYS